MELSAPYQPLLGRLLTLAAVKDLVAVSEPDIGLKVSFEQLVIDALALREELLDRYDRSQATKSDAKPIAVVAPPGYHFLVSFLCTLFSGAVVVPLSSKAPPSELEYYIKTSGSHTLLTDKSAAEIDAFSKHVKANLTQELSVIQIQDGVRRNRSRINLDRFGVTMENAVPSTDPGIIIFTSGTSGPPKGVLKRRTFVYEQPLQLAAMYNLTRDDKAMHVLPVHHVGGLGASLLPALAAGAEIEFHNGGFDPAKVWRRWMDDGGDDITVFNGVPTMWTRLLDHYEARLAGDETTRHKAVAAARRLKILGSGSAALPKPVQDKWSELLSGGDGGSSNGGGGGRRLIERYGSTETDLIVATSPWDTAVPDGSVGKKMLAVDLKFSEGDRGEISVRSPFLLMGYLTGTDDGGTSKLSTAVDADGWFKTGDVGRREGEYYFIEGRASVDILKSGGFKISALDIERAILTLGSSDSGDEDDDVAAAEVAVVGIEDREFGQRVAALLVPKTRTTKTMTLRGLRDRLRPHLAAYKLPTLLRTVDELPRNAMGKVDKKLIMRDMFCDGDERVQRWGPQARL